MSKRRIYSLLITTITFILGIIFQFLLGQWLPSKDIIPLALMVIIIALVLILTISLTTVEFIDPPPGLRVKYIEDGLNGQSYWHSAELIKKAKSNLTFVGPWEPSTEYQSQDAYSSIRNARKEYYKEVMRQIDHYKNNELFHKRIIQVAKEHESQPLPFKIDPVFYEYLAFASNMQENHPRSCRLRRVTSLIHIHFTIVDNKYVILPIFTYIKNERLVRHGVLIFDDSKGELVRNLNNLYNDLDARSQPVEPNQLIAPQDKE
jgi:hypothetical protein